MADFSLPVTGTTYTSYSQAIRDARESVAKWFDATTDSNIVSGFKRWSATNRRFEVYDGSAWGELLPMATAAQAYQIRVERANNADSADGVAGANVSGTVASATNAANLGGVAASQYVQTTDSRMTNSRQCSNTFDSASTSRTNLDVYSKGEMDTALGLKANINSPALVTPTRTTTPAAGDNTHALADTAFVYSAVGAIFGPLIDLSSYANSSSGWTIDRGYARQITKNGSVIGAFYHIDAHASSGSTDGVIADIPKSLSITPDYVYSMIAGCYDSNGGYQTVNIQSNTQYPGNTTVDFYVSRSSSYSYYVRFRALVMLDI